jgi:hypothetical protein
MLFENKVRRFSGDFFNFHAAFARHHEHGLGGRAVEDNPQVQLAGNLAAFFDEDAVDRFAFGAGLDRDELMTEQVLGDFGGVVSRSDELDAALRRVGLNGALAAAPRMDLSLDDGQFSAELFEAAAASSALAATRPQRTATPCLRNRSLAWYSWIFMGSKGRGDAFLYRARGLSGIAPELTIGRLLLDGRSGNKCGVAVFEAER